MTADTPTARAMSEALMDVGIAYENVSSIGTAEQWLPDVELAKRFVRALEVRGYILARADAADAAQQEVERLREALGYIANQLERYWEHGDECATWGDVDTVEAPSVDAESCDCGVADLYRRAALAHPGPSPEADARCVFAMEGMGSCGWYDIWSGHQPPFGDPDYSHHPFTPAQPEPKP